MKRRKILIVANTSWFIQNFELKLMQELQREMDVVAVSPEMSPRPGSPTWVCDMSRSRSAAAG